MLKKYPGICFALAVMGAVPAVVAEYRRIKLGIFDATYWVLAAFLIFSAWCLYQIVGPLYEENAAKDPKKNSDPFTVKCNAISFCALIIAVFAFAASAIISIL